MESMVTEMSSTVISNPVTTSDRVISRRKKNKKTLRNQTQKGNNNNNNSNSESPSNTTEWKTQAQQQVYSSKLLKALREVRIRSSATTPSVPAPKGGRAIREVADKVLAATAKGRTRWSRAILTNRLKLKFMKKHAKGKKMAASSTSRLLSRKPRVGILKLKTKNLPAFQKKARVLGRLVPGCRKQPLPVILHEATDYIAALEMQIRVMSAVADLLSGASSGTTAPLDQLSTNRPPPR